MLLKSTLLLTTLLTNALTAPTVSPQSSPSTLLIEERDTAWKIKAMTRKCGCFGKCNYVFTIHDDTGDHQCTIPQQGYALSSWGPAECVEPSDAGVAVYWKYNFLPCDSGKLTVQFKSAREEATFKWDWVNYRTNLGPMGPSPVTPY